MKDIPPEVRREFETLVGRLCDGVGTTQDRQRLRRMLEEHVELRVEFAISMRLHAHLLWQNMPAKPRSPEELQRWTQAEVVADSPLAELQCSIARNARGADEEQARLVPFGLLNVADETRAAEGPSSAAAKSPVLGFLGDIGRQGWGYVADHATFFVAISALLLSLGWIALRLLPDHGQVAVSKEQEARGAPAQHTVNEAETRGKSDAEVARLVGTTKCRWTSAQVVLAPGAQLSAGQRLELASGTAEIKFGCGAAVRVEGPAIFEVVSAAEMQMDIGKASARVDTPEAKGFAIRMRTLEAVDLGTEFIAQAAPDGHCQVGVTKGRVDVSLPGAPNSKRTLRAGEAVLVEPGTPSIITRIEPGDGTAAFKFPTIEPPSDKDYADASQGHANIRIFRGKPHVNSGPVGVLLDGRGQSTADSRAQSFFFPDNTSGMILMDLGRSVPVRRVNTYSWHQDQDRPAIRIRATQKYLLYGCNDPEPPSVDGRIGNGWTLIARVNTDEFFGMPEAEARPAQQGVSISASQGPIGQYRYLLWDVRPTQSNTETELVTDNTFYGEFDVYAE